MIKPLQSDQRCNCTLDERDWGVSKEEFGRIKRHTEDRRRLDTDQFRRYFEQETTELPQFFMDLARKDLGPLWELAAGRGNASRPERLSQVRDNVSRLFLFQFILLFAV